MRRFAAGLGVGLLLVGGAVYAQRDYAPVEVYIDYAGTLYMYDCTLATPEQTYGVSVYLNVPSGFTIYGCTYRPPYGLPTADPAPNTIPIGRSSPARRADGR